MTEAENQWRVWDEEQSYGDTLYRRAIGELPEMESSKKMAKEVARVFQAGDSLCDVGCGAGHYLRSLEQTLPAGFGYQGVDATANYVALAQKAFADRPKTNFIQSDIFAIELPDRSQDIVMCNNVLLHLPSIRIPLAELVRIARKTVFVRFMVGDRSFQIKDIHPQVLGDEFDDDDAPRGFHFYNIYSRDYVNHLVGRIPGVGKWTITRDNDFDPARILASTSDHNGAIDASGILGGYQVNGYILQPWSVLEISLS